MRDYLKNILGWSTTRKIVVIESDDWGSTRVESNDLMQKLSQKGFKVFNCHMSSMDAIENKHDLDNLFDLIQSFNSRPKLTFLFNPANPNYEKIKKNNFEKYEYIPFDEYLKQTDNGFVVETYLNAIHENLVDIEYHGREHLYVEKWLRYLKAGHPNSIWGFENNFSGFSRKYDYGDIVTFRSKFDLENPQDISSQEKSLLDGKLLIESIFGKSPKYFLAPDGPFSVSLVRELEKINIPYVGLPKNHFDPELQKKSLFWIGKKINKTQRVITRNVMFEPYRSNADWVDHSLNQIKTAFNMFKPAVISTHRVNYISTHSDKNASHSLAELKRLLQAIIKRWPDVEFMSSSQLGDLISKKSIG
jgi:hypothetical protein